MNIILASSSPRRKQLLHSLGLEFTVIHSDFVEKINHSHSPIRIARDMAKHKALAVNHKINNPDILIISGDTIVVLGNRILGKPKSNAEAIRMLTDLSGKTHQVITGLCLLRGKKIIVGHESTQVTFRKLSPIMIKRYVATGEPMDKAGAYGIQGKAALLVKKINGDYFNVMGFPLGKFAEMLKEFKVVLL